MDMAYIRIVQAKSQPKAVSRPAGPKKLRNTPEKVAARAQPMFQLMALSAENMGRSP